MRLWSRAQDSAERSRRPSERRRRIGTAGRLQAARWESEDSETLHTAFVERLNLTIRPGSASLRRRSPCHARGADQLHGHVDRLRGSYHVIRPHRALQCGREPRTPAMHAGLVNAPMNWSDIFTAPAALYACHVAVVRVPVAVQLMHTSPAALSSFLCRTNTDRLPDQQRMAQAPDQPFRHAHLVYDEPQPEGARTLRVRIPRTDPEAR